MIGDFLHDWVFPILFLIVIVLIIGGIVMVATSGTPIHNRAVRYCYSLGLPDVYHVSKSLYCSGIKDGNTVVVPVPDSVLRKE